ncbi:unnamed protein product [Dovyalis caffra]|uniref:Uncharacterized protein n=1 Tax=Dovyalis caffra TaxID=77055 RepID=A0AAV1RTU8_9ROSI|nr:unnamed protein product [Dovyalis caffra]
MTSQRGRGRPPKSSYKNNVLDSTVGYFPQHIARKSRTRTKTISVKSSSRSGLEDAKTLSQCVKEEESSLPQWVTKKKKVNLKSNKQSENISRASNNESSPSSFSKSSVVPWMAEMVIPGPIPDLDYLSDEVDFLKNFFVGIPED